MRSLTLTLAVVAVLLAQGGAHAQTSGLRLPISLPPVTGTVPTLISCESVLVKTSPDNYPHCHCEFGAWSPFRFSSYASSSTCPSGHKYVLDSTRRRLSAQCTQQPSTERRTKDVCEPTLVEKAQKFIESLGLGDRPNMNIRLSSVNLAIADTITVYNHTTTFNTTLIRRLRSRRAVGLPVACPTSESQKSVCTDITSSARSCFRGRRSIKHPQGMELLADLIQQQEHMYSNKIQKRQAGDTSVTNRNVFFVVDSSGSIPANTYGRVLDILANFAKLLCGDVAIGMFTFSRHIDLEFCPTCFRTYDYPFYINEVTNRIKSARYHRSLTHTGEMVKCLRQHVLPSPDCRLLDRKTQIVFFTDGRANGCTGVPPEIAQLEAAYPTLEVYAIGMGNILQSGVLDLLTENFDPYNIFNVQDIDQLEHLYNHILQKILSGQILCSPVSFGK